MKNLFLIIFLVVGTALHASSFECSMSGMQFFPEQREVSLNSMFIIEAYATSRETVESFRDRKVYLESSCGEQVELKILEIHRGQMGLTQAIFRSEKSLEPNETYYLHYSDMTEWEQYELQKWNPDTKEREPVFWKTSDVKRMEPLNPNMSIEFEETEVQFYGCGPAANAVFNVSGKGGSEIWYKTEFVDLQTNDQVIYYIREWQEKLNVGHDMCSGAFIFDKKGKYKVRFTAMNIDGEPLETTGWTTFNSPFESVDNPWGI